MSDEKLRSVKNDWYVGAARRNIDGIAIAEPIMVWGRVKRHSTRGKGGGDDLFSTLSLFTVISLGRPSSPSEPMDRAATRERLCRNVP